MSTEESGTREPIHVVGIGADGWEGLSPVARRTIENAEVVMGGSRQLDLIPETSAERVSWPSPLLPALGELLDRHAGRSICVLASGDPMFHGIGATLARMVGPERLHVVAHPSSVSLACSRLGWPAHEVRVVNLVGRPVKNLLPELARNNRIMVLSSDGDTPAEVGALLSEHGFGDSELVVLENLGGRGERIHRELAARLRDRTGPLNIVAIDRADSSAPAEVAVAPGLPDELYEHDGQLTKRDVRASTLARLAPRPGELLWDVGAGSGSVAIEWIRATRGTAIAVEHDPRRAERVTRNAAALGAGGIRLVRESAPEGLRGLETPDAVFVGGAVSVPGVLDTCVDALPRGGRLVVNAVTMESESTVTEWYSRLGGELTRIGVERAGAVGGFTAWRPALRVTQWAVTKQ
ncbi:precorrin-6y C5,15-methyltransferase (decarboxylating) subunit CbiE [Actinopolyspora mortivallis]|uniref:Cobalamin biosynthesis bifunctional protein CbiET n=1 Tax=Actinopolyspora mortivallis TaxID=33906 RepID=A0A2T0GU17_ACTMO|nr:precorrin-6y C5,15-methyltransferase (decarboxylating) subunit CbiE [Actinopolyspora mortivallis]PRW62590.1 cobalamin biosynthesis bifunctional protein CbiET [Actinopolyspora mortivallis]